MPNIDQPPKTLQEGGSTSPAEVPTHTEPEDPHELWVQERDPFEDFTAQIDANDERRASTPEERAEMDARLEALGDLFAGSTARWHLDGAMNISLLAGDYIGVHKDVDISIDADDLDALEPILRERGYGFFLSKLKDSKDEKSPRILQRVGADALRRSGEHATLAAIDARGKVREDAPLNFVDVHLMRREPDGRVRGIGDLGSPIPARWCEGIPTEFHGRTIQRSHPAKVAYFKLHQTRSYDRTDLEKLTKTGSLTVEDAGAVVEVFRQDLERRRAKAGEIFGGVASRIHPGATAGEVLEAFREEPFLAADAERWERVLPQLQRVVKRIAAEGGSDPQRIAAIAEDEVGIMRAHAEQMRKVADFRRWVEDAAAAQRILREINT